LGPEASLAFNESYSLGLVGLLDADALRAAFGDSLARHDALRATLSPDGLTLLVAPPGSFDLPLIDLAGLPVEARDEEISRLLALEVETPFDLERGPLLRASLLRRAPDDHQLVFTGHHIVLDGWSAAVLVADWARLYAARVQGQAGVLPPADSFADYALAEAERLEAPGAAASEAYWLAQYEGEIPVADLPFDRARPVFKSFASRREDYALPPDLVASLRATAAAAGATFFVTLLAGFAALLRRLTGQDDLPLGIPAAGQAAAGRPSLVGHCVHVLPVRARVGLEDSFRDLVDRLSHSMLEAFEHQSLTLGTLLQKLPVPRDPSRPPLVSVVFNLERAPAPDAFVFPGLRAELSINPRCFEIFDLFVNVVESGAGGCRLQCQYNTDLIDRATLVRWLEAFQELLRAAVTDPRARVGDLPAWTRAERLALEAWNATAADYPRDALVHELFAAQARRTPASTAVVYRDEQLDYAALQARVRRLARRLRRRGVRAGMLVGLHLGRSLDMLVGVLGILEAGGAYVPLDPAYPIERLNFMVADSGLSLLVTERALSGRLDLSGAAELLVDAREGPPQETADAPLERSPGASSEGPAYVIYTSGSTGRPKGVVVPHRAHVNFLESMRREPGLGPEDRLLAVTTLSFDIAGLELHLPLSVGACVVLADTETAASGPALRALLERSGCTGMQATPTTWRLLLDAGFRPQPGFKVLCGGEPLTRDLAAALLERVDTVWNMYGPTETTIWSTCAPLRRPLGPIVIGRPIANTQVHVLDSHQGVVPSGAPGEIFIGGEGVTSGYLGRPELTAERFVPDPFGGRGARLYRTGDLARWRPDGSLECLGRTDLQVKVRGFRIELGEVETALGGHGAVARAVVAASAAEAGDTRLVAYLVACPGPRPGDDELREHLRARLPPYMLPQHFVWLERLPLTPSGKIDRKALPAPKAQLAAYVAPRDGRERLVAGLWAETLRLARLSVHDDFFRLGGHSLLAAQMLARLSAEHAVDLPLRAVFEHPTVERFARALGAPDSAAGPRVALSRADPAEPARLAPLQESWWRNAFLTDNFHPNNVHFGLRLDGALRPAALEQALGLLQARHAALRTRFVPDSVDGARPVIACPGDLRTRLAFVDLTGAAPETHARLLQGLTRKENQRAFDLAQGPPLRAALARLGPLRHVLLLTAHHLVCDNWSVNLLLSELGTLYASLLRGEPGQLHELPCEYADFARWQRSRLAAADETPALARLRLRLQPPLHALFAPLPSDEDPALYFAVRGRARFELDGADLAAAQRVARRERATLFATVMAAFKCVLHEITRQRDVRLGALAANRGVRGTEGIVGLFTDVICLRTWIGPDDSFGDLVRGVHRGAAEAATDQDLPFETVIRRLGLGQAANLIQVFVIWEAAPPPFAFPGLEADVYDEENDDSTTLVRNNLDLRLELLEREGRLRGSLTYRPTRFTADDVERMVAALRWILSAADGDPSVTVDALCRRLRPS
jgi:amino acid adenylation domain-containing protein